MSDLIDMYVDAAERRRFGAGRPIPPSLAAGLVDLLSRRPDLAGIGLSCLAEAVLA